MKDNLYLLASVTVGNDGNRESRLLGAGFGCPCCLLSDWGTTDNPPSLLNCESDDVHDILLLPSQPPGLEHYYARLRQLEYRVAGVSVFVADIFNLAKLR